jgi:hypothetical protein
MLIKVLKALELSGPTADINLLSRRLGIEPAALQGMLDTLVELGRLEKRPALSPACADCPLNPSCSPSRSGYCYVLTPPAAATPAVSPFVQGGRAKLD